MQQISQWNLIPFQPGKGVFESADSDFMLLRHGHYSKTKTVLLPITSTCLLRYALQHFSLGYVGYGKLANA